MSNSDFMPVLLREKPRHYADGGMVHSAKKIAASGRYGDDVVVHVNRKELEEMKQRWGEPTINPHTGCPEFFLGGLRDWFNENQWAGAVLPIAGSILAPGIGQAVGDSIGGATGLVDAGSTASKALGNALTYGGLGYLTGGGQGALTGALLGGITPYAMNAFNGTGAGAASAVGPKISEGDQAAIKAANPGYSSDSGGLFGGSGGMAKILPALALAGAVSGLAGGSKKGANTVDPQQQQAINSQNQHLSMVQWNRTPTRMPRDLTHYGERPQGEHEFYANNYLARGGMPTVHPTLSRMAQGGPQAGGALQIAATPQYKSPHQVVGAPGGRADKIPSMLSNKEYVWDAETTALLGDGDPDEGARKLDEMRAQIRAHKGPALSKGKISPNAKPALAYLKNTKRSASA
jgi:hypothetical protein